MHAPSTQLGTAALALVLFVLGLATAPAAHADCAAPANRIVAENCLPGTPPAIWDIPEAGSSAIQGFATDISADQGQTIHFKIASDAAYRIDIYRLGWYGGDGARKVATIGGLGASSQPACGGDPSVGLVDCGNWRESAAWSVPASATSGIYFAHLVQPGGSRGESHVPFVVRDDDGRSDLLFQTSDTTWQAYNTYGGSSLYTSPAPAGRAFKVSYNRPFATRAVDSGEDWLFNAEYPMVRWLERNGYDVSYFTGVDSDRRGAEIREHRAFLSVGHDEYWSGAQRANAEAARDAGVSLAFFSGNEVFWKTRWENDHRTLVTYKETHGDAIDPSGAATGSWRDPRFGTDAGRPENGLTGTIFMVNGPATFAMQVPAADGRMRFWRGTDVSAQPDGATATLPDGTLGYEWDEDLDNGARPSGLVQLSSTTVPGVPLLQDYGHTYDSGTATHHLTLYRDTNGTGPDALVFGGGTVQWSWGLDETHDRGNAAPSLDMQQATANLFADMSVQPATRQAALQPAACSTDTSAPSVSITSTGATVQGSAVDSGGGRVGAVEVSVDGGSTWHPAVGRASWRYVVPTGQATATPLARAVDDSGNLTGSGPWTSTRCVGATLGVGAGALSPAGGNGGVAGARRPTLLKGVGVRSRSLRMSRKGTVALRVTCPSGGPNCRVHLRLRLRARTIATRTLTVRRGRTRTFTLKLSHAARRTLLQKGALRVQAVASVTHRRTTTVSIRLRAPRGVAGR